MNFQRKISVLFAVFVILTYSSFASAVIRRRVDCQKYVFAPMCRGSTAKRDIGGAREIVEDTNFIRYPSQMDEYMAFQADTGKPVNVVDARTILSALLKAAAVRSADYDSGIGNYSTQ